MRAFQAARALQERPRRAARKRSPTSGSNQPTSHTHCLCWRYDVALLSLGRSPNQLLILFANAMFEDVLRQSFRDFRLSRGEKRDLKSLVKRCGQDTHQLALARSEAFEMAQEAINESNQPDVLRWLEEVVKALQGSSASQPSAGAEVHFSPDDPCAERIIRMFQSTRRNADIAVFTITDNRISRAISDAHDRGIKIRIISDNDKSQDLGSDIESLAKSGIEVRVDQTEHHMHHKYAIFDHQHLLTGSYNWTRSASLHNSENFLITADDYLVGQFRKAFQRLWNSLG